MTPDELTFMINMLKDRSGLTLTPEKAYLIESRLTPIARSRDLGGLSDLIKVLRTNPPQDLLVEVTEAMTTNESSFFRDGKPFEHFMKIIMPAVMEQAGTRKKLRLWSAACSTGQEPYTLAVTWLEEALKHPAYELEILGTDLAQKVIDKAIEGKYSQFEVQRGMPIKTLVKYFKPNQDTSWVAGDKLKGMIEFKAANLLENLTSFGKFDIIFCRNVLIYFDEATKAKAIDSLCNQLEPKGFLFLGATEVVMESNKDRLELVPETRGIYQLK